MPLRDISGHRTLIELLAGAAVRGSLSPSLIFAGPEGVGKQTAALALAAVLNCQAPVEWGSGRDACGVCAACTRIARGVHADILTIQPGDTGSIKVDQIREAIERSAYRPFEGRRRVVIVDGADAMVAEAQNALLKTLEEPPAASTFVLVTPRPDVLLPTVRSRCQHLRFGRLSPADIAGILIKAHGYSEADAYAAASASDGSVGVAIDGGTEEFVEARDAAKRLLQGVAASTDPRRRLESAKALAAAGRGNTDREQLARRLLALASMLRDLGLLAAGVHERSLANVDLVSFLRGVARTFDSARALTAFGAVDTALDALERNASPKIVADWLAVRI